MIESRTCSIQSHCKNAFHMMNDLRHSGYLCDVSLCVEGQKFQAHKIVLAGSSPYLKAMFTNGMLETDQDVVEIRDIDALTMQCLLEFMYTSTIEITVHNVQNVLQGASLLGLHQLRQLTAQFLQLQLTASNCLGIQYFADIYMCTELERCARNFIYQNFLEVVHSEEFFLLSEERLIDFLRSDKLQVMSELQVFEAAYTWLKYDPVTRSESACNVLKHIKLGLLELPMLENNVLKSDFFRTCPKCQTVISAAIRCQYERQNMDLLTPRAHPPCIYVVGGRNSEVCQLKSMERYDFWTDCWSSMPGMNIARTAIGVVTLDGMLYSIGGECALIDTQENTLYLRCVECYDPVQRQWIPKPEMKIARSFVAVAALHGCLYAVGGEDRACGYNIVEKYDPKLEQWSFVSSMKRRRAGAGITVCEGKIYVAGAAPVFNPTTYSAFLGINTSVNTVLASLVYTFSDPNEVVTLSMDPSIDGYSYFGFSGNDVILATGLDVEFGGTTWTARILAVDNGTTPETGSATLSLTTYESTTTTTTTPAPPGYSWFDQQENVILFGSFFAFMAMLTGICVLMCFRFHRIGTCLPRNCPEYRQCRASARRQCNCCILPCTFSDHAPLEKDDTFVYSERETSNASLSKKAVASKPLPPPILISKKGDSNASRHATVHSPTRNVTPVVMGNVDLRDVGFDGMMSPGFNAPMFTSYGGSSDTGGTSNKKRRKKRPL